MRIRRVLATALLSGGLLFALGGAASADVEWCDTGSPPPNDFRFRMTGSPSSTSSLAWLTSTTSGTLDLASGVNTLEGGVATGMWTALRHAPSSEESQGLHVDDDHDEDEDGEDDD